MDRMYSLLTFEAGKHKIPFHSLNQFTEEIKNRTGINETNQRFYMNGERILLKNLGCQRHGKIQVIEHPQTSIILFLNTPWGNTKIITEYDENIGGVFIRFKELYKRNLALVFTLLYNNRDIKTFDDLKNIPNNSQLFYRENKGDSITILVLNVQGDFSLRIRLDMTIEKLFKTLKTTAGEDYNRIICRNRIYSEHDFHLQIKDTEIMYTNRIKAVLFFRGGGGGFDFNSMENSETYGLSSTGPPWTIVKKGFSFQAICKNYNCQAFRKLMTCNIGLGVFDVGKEKKKAKCVMCEGTDLDIKGCGFYDCSYSFEGLLKETFKKRKGNGKVDDKRYVEFSDNKTVKWKFLIIEVEELPKKLRLV